MEKKRIEYLDIAKGILMILVVLGHVFLNSPLQYFIYSFHMPAFFIISGILFNHSKTLYKSMKNVLEARAYTLLVPYMIFELLGTFSDIIQNGFYLNIKGFVFEYIYSLITVRSANNWGNWFLVTLFMAEIYFVFVWKKSNNKGIIIVLSGVLAVVFLLLSEGHVHLVFKRAIIAYIFLVIGYYYGKILYMKNSNVLIMMAFSLTLMSTVFNYKIDINYGIINNPILFLVGSISGTYFILQISKLKCFACMRFIGENSLIIMGVHVPLIIIFSSIMDTSSIQMQIIEFAFVIVASISISILYLGLKKRIELMSI